MEYQLIEFVKTNPVLYQKKYKSSSKYTGAKMEKWIELAKILRRDVTFVRSKWKNLRDTYRKQLFRKPKGSGSGGDEEEYAENSNWKFFNELSFLKEEYENNKLDAAYEETDESEFDTSQYDAEESTYTEDPNEETVVDFEVENFDLNEYLKRFEVKPSTSAANSNDNQAEHSTPMTAEEAHQVKRKKLDKDAIISDACQEMSALLQNAKQHFMPPSPNQVFFNSIALQVEQAKLPPMELMRLQQRVLELVTHEIILYQERTYHITT